MFDMRPSRVLKRLRNGEVAYSFKHNINDPRPVEIAAMHGFDCLWICTEHVAMDWSVVEAQIYAAKAYDADVLVRVARGSYSDYIRPLELDAAGIMVPHVMSADDARQVVRRTRFHPLGRRPADGGNADGRYCNLDFAEYIRQANEQRFICIQIEDPEPLDELDEICSTEGIDIIFFGPGDFSHGVGVPGQLDHPKVLEAKKRVAEAAVRHGKTAGTTAVPETVEQTVEMGYRFLNVGSDVTGLSKHVRRIAEQIGRLRNGGSARYRGGE